MVYYDLHCNTGVIILYYRRVIKGLLPLTSHFWSHRDLVLVLLCTLPMPAHLREVIQEPLSQPGGTTNQNLTPESDSNQQSSSRRPIDLHWFDDDDAYKKGFPGNSRECEVKTIKDWEQCATRIKSWMDGNWLKMNNGKTEFIMFGSQYQLNKCVTHQININWVSVQSVDVIRYLGAWMDQHLSLKHHIKVECKAAMFTLIRIKRLRSYLMESMCNILAMSSDVGHWLCKQHTNETTRLCPRPDAEGAGHGS